MTAYINLSRAPLVTPILAVMLVGSFGCRRTETYRDNNVTAGEIRNPIREYFHHGDRRTYLEVKGKTYTEVRGRPPYYLAIPELNAILFVTEERQYKDTFHIVNLEAGQDVVIDGGNLGFGWNIGAPRKAGDPFTDYVLEANGKRLVIATRVDGAKETITLNLASRTVELRERYLYDASGAVTKHFVNGEAVR